MAGVKLLLIRHPQPLGAEGLCYGQHDLEAEIDPVALEALREQLSALGVNLGGPVLGAEAGATSKAMSGEFSGPNTPLWSSPLRRCRILAEALHPSPRFDDRLMELNFGLWEGRPWEAIPRAELDAWAADVTGYAPPGGESAKDLNRRLGAFLSEHGAETMVLVTHAGVIRTLLARAAGQAVSEWLNWPVGFGSLTHCEIPA